MSMVIGFVLGAVAAIWGIGWLERNFSTRTVITVLTLVLVVLTPITVAGWATADFIDDEVCEAQL